MAAVTICSDFGAQNPPFPHLFAKVIYNQLQIIHTDGKEGNKHVGLRKTTETGKLDRELDKCTIYREGKPIKNFSQSLQK